MALQASATIRPQDAAANAVSFNYPWKNVSLPRAELFALKL